MTMWTMTMMTTTAAQIRRRKNAAMRKLSKQCAMTTKYAAEFAMRYVHLYHDAAACASHAEYLNSRHFGGSQPFFLRTVATIAHKHVCFPVNCQAKLKSLRLRLLLLACVPCMYMCVCVNQETPPAQTVNEIVALTKQKQKCAHYTGSNIQIFTRSRIPLAKRRCKTSHRSDTKKKGKISLFAFQFFGF